MDDNRLQSADPAAVTAQQLLVAMAAERELFEEKLSRIEGTLETKTRHLSEMIQWVGILGLVLAVIVGLGSIIMAIRVGENSEAVELLIEAPMPPPDVPAPPPGDRF